MLLGTALALAVAGCGDSPTGPADSFETDIRGMTLADWTADGYSRAGSTIDDIYATGVNTLAIVITAYQSDAGSSEVRADNRRTPTPQSVADAIFDARAVDPFAPLRVVLKPHIDLDTGGWRGEIDPSDPGAWFASYKAFLSPYIAIAEGGAVEQFIVGTELAGTVEHEGQWRELIDYVRSTYSGEIAYAASWDEAPTVPFWDAVDVMGINFYAPVARRLSSGRLDMLAGWQPWLSRIRLLHKQSNRDIILTEIGYRSIDGAGLHPYDFARQAPIDLGEQADLYWAAMQAIGDKPWIRGMYWWNWLVDAAPEQERADYTPHGKPAEMELINAWK